MKMKLIKSFKQILIVSVIGLGVSALNSLNPNDEKPPSVVAEILNQYNYM